MDGETVPQYMRGEGFGQPSASPRAVTRLLQSATADRVGGRPAGKQPRAGSAQAPPVPQHLEQIRREHHIAIPLAFALLDANHHAVTVDIAGAEPNRFGDPEASGVARRQDRSVLGGRDAIERAHHFVGTEHDREPMRFLRRADHVWAHPTDRYGADRSRRGDLRRPQAGRCRGDGGPVAGLGIRLDDGDTAAGQLRSRGLPPQLGVRNLRGRAGRARHDQVARVTHQAQRSRPSPMTLPRRQALRPAAQAPPP